MCRNDLRPHQLVLPDAMCDRKTAVVAPVGRGCCDCEVEGPRRVLGAAPPVYAEWELQISAQLSLVRRGYAEGSALMLDLTF